MALSPATRQNELARAAASYRAYLNQLDSSTSLTDPGDGGTLPVTQSGTLLMTCAGVETRTLPDPTFIGQKINLVLDSNTGTSVTVTASSDLDSIGSTTLTYTAEGSSARLVAVQVDGTDLVWRVFLAEGVSAAPTLS